MHNCHIRLDYAIFAVLALYYRCSAVHIAISQYWRENLGLLKCIRISIIPSFDIFRVVCLAHRVVHSPAPRKPPWISLHALWHIWPGELGASFLLLAREWLADISYQYIRQPPHCSAPCPLPKSLHLCHEKIPVMLAWNKSGQDMDRPTIILCVIVYRRL